MGSEMCIRDRQIGRAFQPRMQEYPTAQFLGQSGVAAHFAVHLQVCLLYTSDAADERSSVDLGGRRIIKKKKKIDIGDVGIATRTTHYQRSITLSTY